MDSNVTYLGANSYSGPSPAIWGGCTVPYGQPEKGVHLFDDFNGPLLAANVAAGNLGQFSAYTSATAASYIIDANIVGGGITLETTTDNEGAALRSLPAFKIAVGQGRLWFEARIKMLNITDSKFNVFCGLVETGAVAATLPLTTSDAVSDNNLVGFQRVFADGDALDTTYKADTVTQVTVAADAIVTVADTFVKVGMYFDGEVLYFYKNGVRLADSKTIPTTTGDFPMDVPLGVVFAIMSGHADTCSASIDWIRCAQERVA